MDPPENSVGFHSDGSTLETAERIILRWDSASSEQARGKMIFQSDRDEVDRFLRAVDEIQRSLSSLSLSSPPSSSAAVAASAAIDDQEVKANSAIQIAMARLEEEFRNILLSQTQRINYQRGTWVRVLNSLRDEELHVSGSFSSGVSRSALRDRFKAFNAMFEVVHRTQSTWSVPDAQLREELRISLSEHLIPAYRSFLGRFRGHIESGRHPENYLKYSVEDIETIVLDFFEGYTTPPHLRRR